MSGEIDDERSMMKKIIFRFQTITGVIAGNLNFSLRYLTHPRFRAGYALGFGKSIDVLLVINILLLNRGRYRQRALFNSPVGRPQCRAQCSYEDKKKREHR